MDAKTSLLTSLNSILDKFTTGEPAPSKREAMQYRWEDRWMPFISDKRDSPAESEIGTIQFGIDKGYNPNWDFKPEYSSKHTEDDLVPVSIIGDVYTDHFKDAAAVDAFVKEAQARGYKLAEASPSQNKLSSLLSLKPKAPQLDHTSLDRLSDTDIAMLDNPMQGMWVTPNAPMRRGQSPEYKGLLEWLKQRWERGDFVTTEVEALDKSTQNLDLLDLAFRGGAAPGYNIGSRHEPSIEQQSQLPGQIIDESTGEPARLISYVEGIKDLETVNDYMQDAPTNALYAAMASDIAQVHKDADTSFMPTARTTVASEASKFVPLYFTHKFINPKTSRVEQLYFPVTNNMLVQRMREDEINAFWEKQQLQLFGED